MFTINKHKILTSIVGATAAVAVVFGASSAFAADRITIRNHQTGARSNNESMVTVRRDNSFRFDHRTNVDNDFDLRFRSGGNTANFNTGDADIRTGNVNADILIRNASSNTNWRDLNRWLSNSGFTSGFSGVDISANNERTGFRSDNRIDVDLDSSSDVRIDHRVDINNTVDVDSQTGNNRASGNTGDASIRTGDSNIDISIEN